MRSRLSGRTSAGEMYRMRADQDPDVWTLVDACTECGQRRRMAGSEWKGTNQRLTLRRAIAEYS